MKKNKLRYLSVVSLLTMCFCFTSCLTYTIVSAVTSAKKKAKTTQQQQQGQTVTEEYGKTVTLVTSGSGATKEDATRNALRSALEQAYGTFVSSNTTVVNDELVADVISSVSSGDVLSYEIISSLNTSQGFSVSVKAVVSLGKLVSFATNHGMTAELPGNTFVMNLNLARLNKENERIALRNLADQLSIIAGKGLYDFSVEVAQPKTNNAYRPNAAYKIEIKVNVKPNANFNLFWETIDRTLSSLSMSQTESENYKNLEMKTYTYGYLPSRDFFKLVDGHKYILRNNIGGFLYGRPFSDENTEVCLIKFIDAYVRICKFCYELYDNIGNIVTPAVYVNRDKHSFPLYELDGPIVGTPDAALSIVLKETCSLNHRLSRPYESHEGRIDGYDFVLQYNESELSNLRNISIRPHSIVFPKEMTTLIIKNEN